MLLILVEAESGQQRETVLPDRPCFTIGREGDVRPTVQGVGVISRIHATVTRQLDGTWLIVDGDGQVPSHNGLWVDGERVSQKIIKDPGGFVDLLPPSDSGKLLVRVSGARDTVDKPDRGTTGMERYEIETIYEELGRIKDSQQAQADQMLAQSDRLDMIEQNQHTVGDELHKKLDLMVGKIDGLANDNQRQDSQIKGLRWVVGVLFAMALVGAGIDKAHRQEYLEAALAVGLGGGGMVAIGAKGGKP
jgi:FHA domain